jgi:hypothetical protein
VSVGIVDRLEAVEIDEEHRQARRRAVDARHRAGQLVFEDQPVGQLRQRVVVGDLLQVGIGLAQRLLQAVGAGEQMMLDARHEARHRQAEHRGETGQQGRMLRRHAAARHAERNRRVDGQRQRADQRRAGERCCHGAVPRRPAQQPLAEHDEADERGGGEQPRGAERPGRRRDPRPRVHRLQRDQRQRRQRRQPAGQHRADGGKVAPIRQRDRRGAEQTERRADGEQPRGHQQRSVVRELAVAVAGKQHQQHSGPQPGAPRQRAAEQPVPRGGVPLGAHMAHDVQRGVRQVCAQQQRRCEQGNSYRQGLHDNPFRTEKSRGWQYCNQDATRLRMFQPAWP